PSPMTNYDNPRDQFRYQNHLRGYQDLFAVGLDPEKIGKSAFDYAATSEPNGDYYLDLSLLTVGSIVATVINAVPNVVFDWGISLSPSLISYDHGIARTFGAIPSKCGADIPHCVYEYPNPKHA